METALELTQWNWLRIVSGETDQDGNKIADDNFKQNFWIKLEILHHKARQYASDPHMTLTFPFLIQKHNLNFTPGTSCHDCGYSFQSLSR